MFTMKKLFLMFAAVAALVGCDKDDEKVVYKAEINLSEVTVYAGNTKQLDATITPATDVVWEWSSSNETIATVDGSGMVTAVAPGEATIKASTAVGSTIVFAESKVTVVEKPTIALDKESAEILVGKTLELTATATPADAVVEWATSDAAIATVENGVVTGVAKGEATITARVAGEAFAECKVTVSTPVIALETKIADLGVGYTLTLKPIVKPKGTQVEWETSDAAIATVDAGVVTGVAEGEATIKAKVSDDIFAECKVTVKKAYKIGDVIAFGSEKGIVFWLNEVGTEGKAVSFSEKLGLLWANSGCEFNCAASSEEDGEFNTDKIKKVGIEYHPAAKWCVDLGEGWYLPAITEGTNFVTKASVLNPIIKANGGTEIKDSGVDWYWSSTEGESEPNYEVMCFYGGTGFMHTYGEFKTSPEEDCYVRAVHKF